MPKNLTNGAFLCASIRNVHRWQVRRQLSNSEWRCTDARGDLCQDDALLDFEEQRQHAFVRHTAQHARTPPMSGKHQNMQRPTPYQ